MTYNVNEIDLVLTLGSIEAKSIVLVGPISPVGCPMGFGHPTTLVPLPSSS